MKKIKPEEAKGTLYIVGTPIGNLEDITFRAVRILKEVDLILCEDTRTTSHLLARYGIDTKTSPYHAKSPLSKTEDAIKMLEAGKNIALVSDAGTPGISDPGSLLISKIHGRNKSTEAADRIKVVAIPGPSALISALSISGFTGGGFVFEGFLPHKKGRETVLKKIASSSETHVLYESSHRIMRTLNSLKELAPTRHIMIARELTKLFEETISGTSGEVEGVLLKDPKKIRGEFVVIIYGT